MADPDWALQAVTGLLRAGSRSARPGEQLTLAARADGNDPESPTSGPSRVRITLASAGHSVRLLGGNLRIESRGDVGTEAVLEMVSRGEPEHRAGWIP